MSNDDFNSLINKIYQMQKQIEQQNEITLIEDEKVEPEIEE
ncbi:4327_t:CDS:1, partial [Entrophospora sp. SA101]